MYQLFLHFQGEKNSKSEGCGRFRHADRAIGQHEHPDHHGRGESGRHDQDDAQLPHAGGAPYSAVQLNSQRNWYLQQMKEHVM